MPFGCFGKRKKQDRAEKPNEKSGVDDGTTAKSNSGEDSVTKPAEDSNVEVNEVIAVARAHSLHASAPNSVEHRHTTIGIQKSATLARYDFLRKSDYTNTADRWAALKQQYLEQHAGQNGSAGGSAGTADNKVKRTAMSLPRQFAPPNSANTVVRFSQWFYERQTMESDARKEFQEREEKTRKLLDGVELGDSIPEESAASKTDVADKSSEQAPEVEENPASKNTEEEKTETAGPGDAADDAESSPIKQVSEQQEESSKAEPNAVEGDQDHAVHESDEKRSQNGEEADEVNETAETSQEAKAENNVEENAKSSDAVEPAAKLTDDGPAVEADASDNHD